jgi:hypothetical protein
MIATMTQPSTRMLCQRIRPKPLFQTERQHSVLYVQCPKSTNKERLDRFLTVVSFYKDPCTLATFSDIKQTDHSRKAHHTMGNNNKSRMPQSMFDPLDMLDNVAPRNPRDHSILETIWRGMLESRFVNSAPLSLLPTYLDYHFQGGCYNASSSVWLINNCFFQMSVPTHLYCIHSHLFPTSHRRLRQKKLTLYQKRMAALSLPRLSPCP